LLERSRIMADTSQKISNIKDKAKDAAAGLADKARDAASNLGDKAKDLASGAVERTDDALASVGQGMESLAGTLRQKAPHEGMLGSTASAVAGQLEAGGRYLQEHGLEDMGEDLRRLIRQYPLGSVLAVFGAGFLLGRMWR
jgi:hypothetical protein